MSALDGLGDPCTEGCACAVLELEERGPLGDDDEGVDPFHDDGPADPDRPWRWRDGEEQTGGDPDDGPIETDASWAAFVAFARRAGIALP